RLHLAAVRGIAAAGGRVVGAAQLDHLARGVLDRFAAGDEIGVAQPHLLARRKTKEFLWRVLHEIFALDKKLAPEPDAPAPGGSVLGIVDGVELLALALRI